MSETGEQGFDFGLSKQEGPQANVGLSEIQAEAERLIAERAPVPHADVWRDILDALEPIDFREAAQLEDDEKLSQKHYVVITVREVLRVARKLGCGLCR